MNHEVFDNTVTYIELADVVRLLFARAPPHSPMKDSTLVALWNIVLSAGQVDEMRRSATVVYRTSTCPTYLTSPVHNWRKFSAVLGTMSLKSSIFSRPTLVSPTLRSKKTIGRCVAASMPFAAEGVDDAMMVPKQQGSVVDAVKALLPCKNQNVIGTSGKR